MDVLFRFVCVREKREKNNRRREGWPQHAREKGRAKKKTGSVGSADGTAVNTLRETDGTWVCGTTARQETMHTTKRFFDDEMVRTW